MRNVILSTIFLCLPAFGVQQSFFKTASGGSPIPQNYSASSTQSLVMSNLSGVKEVCVWNGTAYRVAFSILGTNTTAPSNDAQEVNLPGGVNAWSCVGDDVAGLGQMRALYIRGPGAAITASESVWGFAR